MRFRHLSNRNASFSGCGRWLDGGERLEVRPFGGGGVWDVNKGEDDMAFVMVNTCIFP